MLMKNSRRDIEIKLKTPTYFETMPKKKLLRNSTQILPNMGIVVFYFYMRRRGEVIELIIVMFWGTKKSVKIHEMKAFMEM